METRLATLLHHSSHLWQLSFSVTQIPSSGSLCQLSQVFSSYGYEPKDGKIITSVPAVVTGSKSRVYYKRPSTDVASNQKWGTFTYAVSDGKVTSFSASITLVPPSGALVGSNFLLSNEGWTIVGNKALSSPAKHEPYSRGQAINQYVLGTEDKINVGSTGAEDSSLWFFRAPAAYLGNQGIAYGGQLKFTLASFSGDFTALNSHVRPSPSSPFLRPDTVSAGPTGSSRLRHLQGSSGKGHHSCLPSLYRSAVHSLLSRRNFFLSLSHGGRRLAEGPSERPQGVDCPHEMRPPAGAVPPLLVGHPRRLDLLVRDGGAGRGADPEHQRGQDPSLRYEPRRCEHLLLRCLPWIDTEADRRQGMTAE
jgi:hypothetical protein